MLAGVSGACFDGGQGIAGAARAEAQRRLGNYCPCPILQLRMDQMLETACVKDLERNWPVAKPRVGLDGLDQLPAATIPKRLMEGSMRSLLDGINAIADEGPRGPAMIRLLARDVQLARAQLRFREAIFNREAERIFLGQGDPRMLEIAERLVAGQHRRLLESIDMLSRLDRNRVAPRVAVQARATRFTVRPH